MTEGKKYSIVAQRGKDTRQQREISAGAADGWLDEYAEHGWSVRITECGTDRVVSRKEVADQWKADAAASAAKAEAARQGQTTKAAPVTPASPKPSDEGSK